MYFETKCPNQASLFCGQYQFLKMRKSIAQYEINTVYECHYFPQWDIDNIQLPSKR